MQASTLILWFRLIDANKIPNNLDNKMTLASKEYILEVRRANHSPVKPNEYPLF